MLRISTVVLATALITAPVAADELHFRPVYKFTDLSDGWAPVVVASDKSGNLYGYTNLGGAGPCTHGCGTVFKLKPNGTKTVLHDFNPTDGAGVSGLTIDASGTLYGTTEGAKAGYGSVFKLTADGQFSQLFAFPGYTEHHQLHVPDGMLPQSGVLVGQDGNLYGTASYGGINNHCGQGGCGTVFKLTTAGEFTLLHAFGGEDGDGCRPSAGLAQDPQGYLYGTTVGCGHTNFGSVFKVDPATGATTTLHVFTGGRDGATPSGSVTPDEAGNLYGVTGDGGNECNGGTGCGTIYKIAPDGTETILHAFNSFVDGFGAQGNLYRDRRGNLYGITFFGGTSAQFSCITMGCGSVYKLKPDGKKISLYNFHGTPLEAAGPFYGLIPGPHRNTFYGTTQYTGHFECCGTVFELKP